MEDFLRNFRSGFALACGFPITRDDFRPGLKQTASLGAIVVMTLTLYPYVYLLARAALVEQAPGTYDVARTLGASRSRAFSMLS